MVAQEEIKSKNISRSERLEQVKDYLGVGIHSIQTGPRADVPDANVPITGAPSSCQYIGLPGTPSYSLDGTKVESAGNPRSSRGS